MPVFARMHVMAGVLVDGAGRILLAERPAGKHLAGLWEFPGGKLEPGERPRDGLARELREELGIETLACCPLIELPWIYADRSLLLDVWRVTAWSGTPSPLEGQALRWLRPQDADPAVLAPADQVVLRKLCAAN